jgi:hypothetical protein
MMSKNEAYQKLRDWGVKGHDLYSLNTLFSFAVDLAEEKYPPIDGMGRVQVGLHYKSKYLHKVYWATFEATDKSGKVCDYITKDGKNYWWAMFWLIEKMMEKV